MSPDYDEAMRDLAASTAALAPDAPLMQELEQALAALDRLAAAAPQRPATAAPRARRTLPPARGPKARRGRPTTTNEERTTDHA
jgi:hypothetical protein